MSSSTTPLTVSMGTANPTPWATPWEPAEATWELIPMTVPRASKSGPPELPELMAASVWTALSMVNPLGASMGRPSPLTMPVVTLMPTLSGLPMAITGSPTPSAPESPSVSGRSMLSGASTLMTATSVEGASPPSPAAPPPPPRARRRAPPDARAVRGRALPYQLSRLPLAAGELHRDLLGPLHDVLVGDDVSPLVQHEPRAAARARLLGCNVNAHHPGAVLPVHIAHGKPLVADGRRLRR